ncbi:unnamed protein product [Adineta steineri]|uniref:Uncharacterized protein n=1 Tax=Adineta steineri TaxID=433720 RepID=A0A814CYD7_9BILA|nr:unnamed protein product [Adineta steineri]CAF0950860.1 unnamed protein product [Adineta steineri]
MNDDAARLESLGYKQELTRTLNRLTNYGFTLSAISITSGVTSMFAYGMTTGGPIIMVWGWILVSIFTLCVSLGMAEICSSYPTAGGLYFWSANLLPNQYKPMVSWYTAWFNIMGQLAGIVSVDFGLSMLIGSVISIGIGEWSPRPWHILLIHLCVVISHGLFNSLGRTVLLWTTHISTWWQLLAPIIICIALFATGKGQHETPQFVFTSFINHTGWTSTVYVLLIGLLQAQYCLLGYDSAAHMSEETKKADIAGPMGMIGAVLGSSIFGWIFVVSLLTSISDYETTLKTKTGFPVTQILMDNFGRQWTLVLMCMLLIACWFCGLATVTVSSRLIYAFSRDNGMPWSHLWLKIHPRLACPLNAVWLSCAIGFLLGLPYLINSTAYYAVISLCTICLYVAYGLPIFCKLISPVPFPRGRFHLGRFSSYINIIAIMWVMLIVVLFVLPPEYPVTATNMNYASVGFGTLLIVTSLTYMFSARYWFKGPHTNSLADSELKLATNLPN